MASNELARADNSLALFPFVRHSVYSFELHFDFAIRNSQSIKSESITIFVFAENLHVQNNTFFLTCYKHKLSERIQIECSSYFLFYFVCNCVSLGSKIRIAFFTFSVEYEISTGQKVISFSRFVSWWMFHIKWTWIMFIKVSSCFICRAFFQSIDNYSPSLLSSFQCAFPWNR